MLQYIYTGDYDGDAFEYKDDYQTVRLNMLVYVVADLYNLQDLSRLALEKFEECIYHEWRSPAFATVVEELYTWPINLKHQPIRKLVLEVCAGNAKELFTSRKEGKSAYDDPYFHPYRVPKELRAVAYGTPHFAADLAAELAWNV